MSQFRVLLCSSIPLYFNSLAVAFNEKSIFRVIENIEYDQLIDACVRIQPDVVVIKINDQESLTLLTDLKSNCPMLMQVAILDDPSRFNIMDFINCGVHGCLPMRLLPRQIVNAVELIVVCGLLCLPRVNPRSIINYGGIGVLNKNLETVGTLTTREREILDLMCHSFSNQEIAESLCISESTVKTHLRNVFRKLQVRNRSEAISVLYRADTGPV
jgi:DNA-binding NarL/FixJ family response regulator